MQGYGAVSACQRHLGQPVPDSIYISHNHSDHAGELPVLLAVESACKGRLLRVFAHSKVMPRLLKHRLHELVSTGRVGCGLWTVKLCEGRLVD